MNNKDIFIEKFHPKCFEFITIGNQTLCAESIKTIAILLVDGLSIKLERVIYTLQYNSNLILLGQLQKSKINYIDNLIL